MNRTSPSRSPEWLLRAAPVAAVLTVVTMLAACDKAREPVVTPATVVMPATPASTSAADASSPAGVTGDASAPSGGGVSVIASPPGVAASLPDIGTAPTSPSAASAPLATAVPASPPASLPGAGSIGPATPASSANDQPPSVAPGSKT